MAAEVLVRGQQSEVSQVLCVALSGRGVIPVCARPGVPGGVSGPEGGGVRASLARRNA